MFKCAMRAAQFCWYCAVCNLRKSEFIISCKGHIHFLGGPHVACRLETPAVEYYPMTYVLKKKMFHIIYSRQVMLGEYSIRQLWIFLDWLYLNAFFCNTSHFPTKVGQVKGSRHFPHTLTFYNDSSVYFLKDTYMSA